MLVYNVLDFVPMSAHAAGDASAPAAVAAGRGNESSIDAAANAQNDSNQTAWRSNSDLCNNNWDCGACTWASWDACSKETQWQSTGNQSASAAVAADAAKLTGGANPWELPPPPPPHKFKAPPVHLAQGIMRGACDCDEAPQPPAKPPPAPKPSPTYNPKLPQSPPPKSEPPAPTRPTMCAHPTSTVPAPTRPTSPITVPAVAGTSGGSSPPSNGSQRVDAAGAVKEQTRTVFDIAFFKNWSAFRDDYTQHNVALIFFRDQLLQGSVQLPSTAAVAAVGGGGQESMELQPYDMKIAKMVHMRGTDITFDCDEFIEWSWLEMVAQLDEKSMPKVVGNGLVRCELSIRPNSYHAHRRGGRKQPTRKQRVYDFVLWRADDTCIRLNPRWNKPIFETYRVDPPQLRLVEPDEEEHPTSGPGGSDGKCTFKDIGKKAMLRFDPEKTNKSKNWRMIHRHRMSDLFGE